LIHRLAISNREKLIGQKYEYLAISLRSRNPKSLAHHISRFTRDVFELHLIMDETSTTPLHDWGVSHLTYEYTDPDNNGKMTFKDVTKV
jgi:hypothetical protein